MSKSLIAFYSRADENYVGGVLKTLKKGNTEILADIIRELTGADIFEIRQTQPYPKGYNECIAKAQEDQRKDARPELVSYPADIDGYSVIYLGYPNYWGTMPMAVFTFLERFNFDDKIIRPFCTHEGSGMGVSERDIARLCPGAKIEKGLAIRGSRASEAKKDAERWLK